MTLKELLSLPEAILIGSRGLGIETESSDYDIVIPLSSIPLMLQKRLDLRGDYSIERYFNRLPSKGRGWFFKHVCISDYEGSVEVIVLEDRDDLKSVELAIGQLKQIPKHLLLNKQTRINLFEDSLVYYGWKIPIEPEDTDIPY